MHYCIFICSYLYTIYKVYITYTISINIKRTENYLGIKFGSHYAHINLRKIEGKLRKKL